MNFKKRLNEELNNIVPEISSEVLNASFPEVEKEIPLVTKTSFSFKKLLISALAVIVAIVCVAVPLSNKGVAVEESVVLFNVNPSVKLVTNKNGEVISVSSENSDGDVILLEEGVVNSIIGKKIETGVEVLIEKCVEYGYITTSNAKVNVTVGNDSDKEGRAIADRINSSIGKFVAQTGLDISPTVYADKVSAVAEKLGVTYKNAKTFLTEVKNVKTLKVERDIEQVSEHEYLQNYTNSIKAHILEIVNTYAQTMIQKATLLQSIQNAFTAIEENENNPLRLNYYIMKEVVKDVNIPFGDELKTLIFKAEALLKDYNEKFGVDLCDPIIFSTWYNIYYNLDIDKIKNTTITLVNEITDNFEKVAYVVESVILLIPDESIIEKLKTSFEKFNKIPESYVEFKQSSIDIFKDKANAKKENAKTYYNQIFQKN